MKPLTVYCITEKPVGFNAPLLIDSKSAVYPSWEDAEIERLRKYPDKDYVVFEANYLHQYPNGSYGAMLLPENHIRFCIN